MRQLWGTHGGLRVHASNVTNMDDVQALGSRDSYFVIKSQCFAVVFLQRQKCNGVLFGTERKEENGRWGQQT
jgi:hypothetical protein